MTFDIHRIDDLDYMGDENAEREFDDYRDELLKLFADSPEGIKHKDQYPGMGWMDMFMEYGFRYLGYSIPTMDESAVDELLTDILSQKVSLRKREEALDAIPEFIAFWSFVKREYNLENADEILNYLKSYSPDKFADDMMDPRRAGMAKSLFMSGQASGFDMTDMNQANQFISLYNANILDETGQGQQLQARDTAKEKKKRKAAKAARKRNRKR